MIDLSVILDKDDMAEAALERVIAKIRAAVLPRATKRYLLGEWARQVGIKLPASRFQELRGGPEV